MGTLSPDWLQLDHCPGSPGDSILNTINSIWCWWLLRINLRRSFRTARPIRMRQMKAEAGGFKCRNAVWDQPLVATFTTAIVQLWGGGLLVWHMSPEPPFSRQIENIWNINWLQMAEIEHPWLYIDMKYELLKKAVWQSTYPLLPKISYISLALTIICKRNSPETPLLVPLETGSRC